MSIVRDMEKFVIHATFSKRSLCVCGNTVLYEHIQPGTKYLVTILNADPLSHMICGQCGRKIPITIVFATRDGGKPGMLPLEIFSDADQQKFWTLRKEQLPEEAVVQ